eukprot:SAG11_NODE_974_length_6334_cov_29.611387_5_plen_71_part_00
MIERLRRRSSNVGASESVGEHWLGPYGDPLKGLGVGADDLVVRHGEEGRALHLLPQREVGGVAAARLHQR